MLRIIRKDLLPKQIIHSQVNGRLRLVILVPTDIFSAKTISDYNQTKITLTHKKVKRDRFYHQCHLLQRSQS